MKTRNRHMVTAATGTTPTTGRPVAVRPANVQGVFHFLSGS
jgi:hypothetical protein